MIEVNECHVQINTGSQADGFGQTVGKQGEQVHGEPWDATEIVTISRIQGGLKHVIGVATGCKGNARVATGYYGST